MLFKVRRLAYRNRTSLPAEGSSGRRLLGGAAGVAGLALHFAPCGTLPPHNDSSQTMSADADKAKRRTREHTRAHTRAHMGHSFVGILERPLSSYLQRIHVALIAFAWLPKESPLLKSFRVTMALASTIIFLYVG